MSTFPGKTLRNCFSLLHPKHTYFNGEIYDQVDGVAMGSPLAFVLANLFIGHHDQHWLKQKETLSVLFYTRYIDDVFCIFKTSEQGDKF